MHDVQSSTSSTYQALLPIFGASAAFASLIGVVVVFGAVAMAMM